MDRRTRNCDRGKRTKLINDIFLIGRTEKEEEEESEGKKTIFKRKGQKQLSLNPFTGNNKRIVSFSPSGTAELVLFEFYTPKKTRPDYKERKNRKNPILSHGNSNIYKVLILNQWTPWIVLYLKFLFSLMSFKGKFNGNYRFKCFCNICYRTYSNSLTHNRRWRKMRVVFCENLQTWSKSVV